jgi:hypothetical protein
MADHGDDAKCNPEVTGGAYFMGSIMAVTGIMATILVISGIFHSGLRRLGQPSIISHILARRSECIHSNLKTPDFHTLVS